MPEREANGAVRVGRLTKAHGLKGGLKIELYTDAPERRFVPGATFSLQVPSESPWSGKTLEMLELRWLNGQPVGFFVGVTNRTVAESLARAILWFEPGESEPEENAWFDFELVGLTVFRDGIAVGVVAAVEHLPSQDLLVVRTESADVLVPFVAAIVPRVDVAAGRIDVTPPIGLFEDTPQGDEEDDERAAPMMD